MHFEHGTPTFIFYSHAHAKADAQRNTATVADLKMGDPNACRHAASGPTQWVYRGGEVEPEGRGREEVQRYPEYAGTEKGESDEERSRGRGLQGEKNVTQPRLSVAAFVSACSCLIIFLFPRASPSPIYPVDTALPPVLSVTLRAGDWRITGKKPKTMEKGGPKSESSSRTGSNRRSDCWYYGGPRLLLQCNRIACPRNQGSKTPRHGKICTDSTRADESATDPERRRTSSVCCGSVTCAGCLRRSPLHSSRRKN